MNKVFLIGRLTRDAEIRVTQTGKKLASFSIAVNDGKNKDGQELTQFFNLTAWERLAEIVELYIKKGTQVAVFGKLQNRSWDKPDGTKGYATDVLVSDLEILTSKAEAMSMAEKEKTQPENENHQNEKPKSSQSTKKDGELPDIDIDNLNVQMPF